MSEGEQRRSRVDVEPLGHGAGDAFELRRFFPYQLSVLSSRVSKRLLASYREAFGLNISEWRVITHVAGTERLSIREIYGAVNLDKPTVSRSVKRLVAEGLVERETHRKDGRLVQISLTPRGREVFEEVSAIVQKIESEILSALSDKERERLATIFAKLHAALDRDPLAPPRPAD